MQGSGQKTVAWNQEAAPGHSERTALFRPKIAKTLGRTLIRISVPPLPKTAILIKGQILILFDFPPQDGLQADCNRNSEAQKQRLDPGLRRGDGEGKVQLHH